MNDKKIFIHPEYKKRLCEEYQNFWLNIIKNKDDEDGHYFPISAFDDPWFGCYCVDVNTKSINYMSCVVRQK
jgi:hypothetical protein